MNIIREPRGDALLLDVLDSRIDSASAVQFKDEVRRLTSDGHGRVVLDLGRVKFLDSSGIGAVVSVMKQLGPDRALELAALTTNVAKVFALTRLDSVFVIHPSVDAAFPGMENAS